MQGVKLCGLQLLLCVSNYGTFIDGVLYEYNDELNHNLLIGTWWNNLLFGLMENKW